VDFSCACALRQDLPPFLPPVFHPAEVLFAVEFADCTLGPIELCYPDAGASAVREQGAAATGTSTSAQAFKTLGQDLQLGNLSAAQQDFATIQQDAQQAPVQTQHHHRHHRAASSAQQGGSPISQPSERSARPCSPAISRPLSKRTPHFNRTCRSTCRIPGPAPLAPPPACYPHRVGSVSVTA
jgi:hypothetical protein